MAVTVLASIQFLISPPSKTTIHFPYKMSWQTLSGLSDGFQAFVRSKLGSWSSGILLRSGYFSFNYAITVSAVPLSLANQLAFHCSYPSDCPGS